MTERDETPAPLTPQENLQLWMEGFQICIRRKGYDSAEKLFHEKIISFGITEAHNLEALRAEWESTWKGMIAFEFDMKNAKIISHPTLLIVTVGWSHSSLIIGGKITQGRATIILAKFGDKLLCLHMHMSENPTQGA